MSQLAHQRCFHHAGREAVARCPECRQSFCRECITEHDDRILCASCLRRLASVPLTRRRGFVGLVRVLQVGVGLFIAMAFFHKLGTTLLELPNSFHDGTLWRGRWLDEPGADDSGPGGNAGPGAGGGRR